MNVRHIYRTFYTMQLCSICRAMCVWVLISFLSTDTFAISGDHDLPYSKRECSITSVFVNAQQISGEEIPAIICEDTVYLPIMHFFNFLKIKNNTVGDDSTVGYFIEPQNTFVIDKAKRQISYQHSNFILSADDLMEAEGDLFLQIDWYRKIFGLNCEFDLNNLSIKLTTSVDLPAVKLLQDEQIRQQLKRLLEIPVPDTTIKMRHPLFNVGTADWTITGVQGQKGSDDMRGSLSIGSIIAKGEANMTLNYFNRLAFDEKQQYYYWRYADNENNMLRQIVVGKIFPQSTASIYNPVIGLQIGNSRTKPRQTYTDIVINDVTEPGWTVELYVNGILTNFTKADSNGHFSFHVLVSYGSTIMKLQFCGPYGEKKEKEKNIFIPYSFIPPHQLEYTITGGIVEDGKESKYSRASFSYGLNTRITLATGMEYLSSVPANNIMPFVNASFRLTPNLALTGEYAYAVRSKGALLYHSKSNAQLTLSYTNYARDQKAIIFNYLDEKTLAFTTPFHNKYFTGLSMLTLDQVSLPGSIHYSTAQWLLSVILGRVNLNVTTFMIPRNQGDALNVREYVYSDWGLTMRLAKGLTASPQVQYAYQDGQFIAVKCRVEQYAFHKCYFNLSYERHFNAPINYVSLGIQYYFPFTRAAFTTAQYNDEILLIGSANGSISYDPATKFFSSNNRPQVGRGGIAFLPFLDINGNGKRDMGEPKVEGLKVRIKGGKVVYDKTDTLIHVLDLEPYVNYYVDLSQNTFEGLTWQILNKTLAISVMPNQLQLVQIPVNIKNDITGMIKIEGRNNTADHKGIKICFYRIDNSLAGFTYTDNDGSYNYSDLSPGSYLVRIDKDDLERLKMLAVPATIPVIIKNTEYGEIIDDINFTLK